MIEKTFRINEGKFRYIVLPQRAGKYLLSTRIIMIETRPRESESHGGTVSLGPHDDELVTIWITAVDRRSSPSL